MLELFAKRIRFTVTFTFIVSFWLFGGVVVQAGDMTVHFISVGHGDAVFIELPDGSTMLVDGGMPEMGKRVTNYIEDMGYEAIDVVVLTHSHDDHAGGLIKVLSNFEIGELWLCPYLENTELVEEFERIKAVNRLAWKHLASSQRFNFADVKIEILNPPLGSNLERLRGPNGASVVMKLTYENSTLLLAADVDDKTDQELVELWGEKLKSTVLKCAHHGSSHSNSAKFLNMVSPKISVVSTGPSEWGYPDASTIARIEEYSDEFYRTDEAGDVVIELDGNTARVLVP